MFCGGLAQADEKARAAKGTYMASLVQVWGWGYDEDGALGPVRTCCKAPTLLPRLKYIVQVSSGYGTTLAVDRDGRVWMAGHNAYGEAGDGTVSTTGCKCIQNFQRVPGLTRVVAVSAGNSEVVALRNDGTVWTWGGTTLDSWVWGT